MRPQDHDRIQLDVTQRVVGRYLDEAAGKPISTTEITPENLAPGSVTKPNLGKPKVTVWSAITAAPKERPDCESSPVGISTATRSERASLICDTSFCHD